MPDKKIVELSAARRRKEAASDQRMLSLLNRIDELEETLESLDENGITTRDEVVELMERLEREAAALDPNT